MKTIFIDAGHGGRDSGAVYRGRLEKNDNLRLALLVKKKLSEKGFGVILSRESDKALSLKERTDKANSAGADLFISLHRNAFVTSSPRGTEIWIQEGASKDEESFAEILLSKLCLAGISENRGVKKGNFHVNRESRMCSCLAEIGFISNSYDNELFDSKIEGYALAITSAVCEFFGEKAEAETKPAETLYRVQVGAYKNRENALSVKEKLIEAGFPAIIV